jgi:hypothetical protein
MTKIRMIARARPLPKRSDVRRVDAWKAILTLHPMKIKKGAKNPFFVLVARGKRLEVGRYSTDL